MKIYNFSNWLLGIMFTVVVVFLVTIILVTKANSEPIESKTLVTSNVFHHKNHIYIEFRDSYGKTVSVVHDPECITCKEKKCQSNTTPKQ